MKLLLDILYDPRFFAFLSMAIKAGSVIRFAFAKNGGRRFIGWRLLF